MRQLISIKKLALPLIVVAATCVGAAAGHAGNDRTWVSGTGSNTGSCTRTAPCLTFEYAIGQTNSNGEINCLDPAGFGPVTINISVTINCEGVSNGGIELASGYAVTINTAGIIVNLIGLDINGENAALAADGVLISAAANVTIRNCKIYGISEQYGIIFDAGTLLVDNVFISTTGSGGAGIWEASNGVANMTVRNSSIKSTNGADGIFVTLQAGGTHAGATIEQTTLAFNSTGLRVQGSGAIAVLGGSTVVGNGTGVVAASGGIVYSFKNNQIGGNSTDGTPLPAYPGGPLN